MESPARGRWRLRRGVSLVEVMAACLILSFIVAATAQLYVVGERHQRLAGGYSQAQTDLRESLKRATRGIRHGQLVLNPSTEPAFPVQTSSVSQLIVRVPEPSTASPSTVQLRYHLANGTLYRQRADQAVPGMALINGVESVTFNYFRTVGTVRSAVDGAPQTATEVRMTVQARRASARVRVSTLVLLRNNILPYF